MIIFLSVLWKIPSLKSREVGIFAFCIWLRVKPFLFQNEFCWRAQQDPEDKSAMKLYRILWQDVVSFSDTSLHRQGMPSLQWLCPYEGKVPYLTGIDSLWSFNKEQGCVPSGTVTETFPDVNRTSPSRAKESSISLGSLLLFSSS